MESEAHKLLLMREKEKGGGRTRREEEKGIKRGLRVVQGKRGGRRRED